jgi:DeoR/GlpR family transcriptional regulator of sugar metabolism
MNDHAPPTLTAERRDAIADLLVREGAARVSELAERFDVSAATVRRDLERLEDQGTVKRVHGGAVAVERKEREADAAVSSSNVSFSPSPADGARIGRAVAEMIGEGETIFLGPGALSLEVARSLPADVPVTVVTNGLEVAYWVAKQTRHRLIVTGGQREDQALGLVGQLARNALETLRADRVILELDGVSALEGLTQDSLPQAEIAQMLMGAGSEIVVVVPADRVGRVAAARVAPVTSADVVVTGRDAAAAYLWELTEVGVEVVLA